jgi:hypothetical protein
MRIEVVQSVCRTHSSSILALSAKHQRYFKHSQLALFTDHHAEGHGNTEYGFVHVEGLGVGRRHRVSQLIIPRRFCERKGNLFRMPREYFAATHSWPPSSSSKNSPEAAKCRTMASFFWRSVVKYEFSTSRNFMSKLKNLTQI